MRFLKVFVVLLVLGGIVAGVVLTVRAKKGSGELRTVEVKKGTVTVKVSDVGSVEPRLKVEVKSKVAGRITSVLVDEGDWVEKGQTIALVDRTELGRNLRQTLADLEASAAQLAQAKLRVQRAKDTNRTAIAQAEARLVSAQASLRSLKAGARAQELARAEAEVESARIALRDAELVLKQRQTLLGQGVLRRRQAESEVKAAKAALEQLKAGARAEEIRSAEASVQRAEATHAEAKRNLARQQGLLANGFVAQQAVDGAQTQVETAAADVKRAQEQLALVKAGSRREEIDGAQARLDRAEAELAAVGTSNEQEIASLKAKVELAKSDVARARESLSLLREGARPEEIESAEATVREAEAALTAAKDGETDVRVAEEEVARASAAIRRLEQTRDNVQTQLSDTIITAPISGTVIDRAIDPGELVVSGTAAFSQGLPIVTIADLSEMRIEARINEVDVARLQAGQEATIKVDALPDNEMKGVIQKVSPSARGNPPQGQNSGIVMFDVLVVIPDPDPALKTGMSADVDILVDEVHDALYLPLEAVWKKDGKWMARRITNPGAVKAWKKDKGKAKAPQVETKDVSLECGLRSEVSIEIKKGLKKGDLVRTDGLPGAEERRKFEMKGKG